VVIAVSYARHRSLFQLEVEVDATEVNCVRHFDPSLFSPRIPSTDEGLQLKDQVIGTQINGPDRTINLCRCSQPFPVKSADENKQAISLCTEEQPSFVPRMQSKTVDPER
jgi:hypothetical protein